MVSNLRSSAAGALGGGVGGEALMAAIERHRPRVVGNEDVMI